MVVNIKATHTVKPAEPTWVGLLPLSELDQIGTMCHIPTIYFYMPSPSSFSPFMSDTLRNSLAKVLVPFYPFSGRVHSIGGGRLELDCNAAGVHFIEAESEGKLEDFEDFSPCPEFETLIPTVGLSAPLNEQPLFLAQVTKFQCGGFSLGVSVSHVVVDGESALHFIHEWARITRGEPVGTIPILDRKLLLRAGDPPMRQPLLDHPEFNSLPFLLQESNDEEEEEKKKTRLLRLKITRDQVRKLKSRANEFQRADSRGRGYSSYETLAGHLWRTVCKARRLKPEQLTALDVCVSIRRRMQPPLPRSYFGNAIIDVYAVSRSDELVSRPLGYGANRIREAIEKLDGEFVNDAIDFLKNQPDLGKFQLGNPDGPRYENPNLSVVSWLTLPLHELDFGWGKELCMVAGGPHLSDGDSAIIRSPNGDGSVFVVICLQKVYAEAFKKCFFEDIM